IQRWLECAPSIPCARCGSCSTRCTATTTSSAAVSSRACRSRKPGRTMASPRAGSWRELAAKTGLPSDELARTAQRFAQLAKAGTDEDFHRGESAYDRYYGDPTVKPNPNLRPLNERRLYAVRVVLSDLGTCGGLAADK